MSTLTACAQNKTNMNNTIKDLYKTVQHRDKAVEYRANIQVGACNFELLINDIPVEQFFGNANGTFNTSTPINDAILKSGKQRWKLILYPGFKDNQPTTALSPNVLIDIEIEGLKHTANGVEALTEPVALLTTPQRQNAEGKEVYTEAGKPTAVYEGTFDANVPYTLTGWSESTDLRKEDQEQLKKELLSYYEEYAGYYRSKNTERIMEAVAGKEKERAQYFFLDASGLQETYNDYTAFLAFPSPRVLPIEHYRLRFYGDGKIVTLERADFPNIGEPVTRIEYADRNNKPVTEYMFCYLHRKKPGMKLEMIR
jgi:hypothetical protein